MSKESKESLHSRGIASHSTPYQPSRNLPVWGLQLNWLMLKCRNVGAQL